MRDWVDIGFELFDDPKLAAKLDESLRRIGHRLALAKAEDLLITEFDAVILPLGKGEGFALRLEQDWKEIWSSAILYRRPELQELERFEFDRDQRLTTSCFDAWIEAIVLAVRQHSAS